MLESGFNKSRQIRVSVVSGVVTDRDTRALSWVIEQGVMTVDQIFRAVYASETTKSSCYAYKRVRFLEDSKFLVSVSSPDRKERFLKASRHAQKLLSAKGVEGVTRTLNTPTLSEIPHASVLTEIRIEILKSGKHGVGQWWRSEGSLLEDDSFPSARFRDLMPDAVWVTKSGKRVAIEFERTRKGITRIRKKVEGLDLELNRSDRVIDLVLWVAVDGGVTRDLKSAIGTRDTQELRTVDEFLRELRGK